ncbi:hypothetical protein H4F51_18430 [Pectobacterium brasiliense]|nr:hypothetical protein [Pectobacterium brasiliense]MBN3141892.1 hypothetical protein [Pectobacterium brasiliense]MBW5895572.1 hypothetical protein [Pectobacterium brasiliense]
MNAQFMQVGTIIFSSLNGVSDMDMKFTVGDLRRQLSGLSDDIELSFDGGLTFGRLKRWGDDHFVLLFAESQAYTSEEFKKEYDNIMVSFCKPDTFKEL